MFVEKNFLKKVIVTKILEFCRAGAKAPLLAPLPLRACTETSITKQCFDPNLRDHFFVSCRRLYLKFWYLAQLGWVRILRIIITTGLPSEIYKSNYNVLQNRSNVAVALWIFFELTDTCSLAS